ncbi:HAMP domain-containing histidine kinase [Hymenobacter aerilatus]|uniref:histidine kinase n=1 Tax=Hymenobacter aerilatus TaxID=2932251 RepID=A0A8T9SSG9_9BACT|nr:HAMP domain-containing sensor histidine kinase [Hymenobacter aerilatus]UOR03693.1 HAMP domain-containing histidine kinase [Hymenobacter aerilatus]
MSIRLRLALQFGLIVGCTLLIFSLVIYAFTYQARRTLFTESLLGRAQIVGHVYLDGTNRADASRVSYRRYLRQFYRTLPQEEARVYNSQDSIVFYEGVLRTKASPGRLLAEARRLGWSVRHDAAYHQTVALRYRDAQRGTFVVIASSVDMDSERELGNLRLILLVGLLVSFVIVGVGGWFFSGQALRPMKRIVNEVDSITASDLHQRLSETNGQDEVSHLAQRFNSLLDRLETAFAGQRTFVRDASHELRTPLTALIGELEVALMQEERTPAEYHRVLRSTLDAARLLKDLANGLLQIARASDDPSQVPLTQIHLDELLLQAHEEIRRRHPTHRVDLEFSEADASQPTDPFVVRGNEALLLSAVLNVLENACKFSTDPPQPIVATLLTTPHAIRLLVRDQGVGMTLEDQQQVFVPFFRAENVRTVPGHGIGLPLTAKIMELHGGSIQVRSRLHEGTEVELILPVS